MTAVQCYVQNVEIVYVFQHATKWFKKVEIGMRPFRFIEIVRIFINTVRKALIKRYHGNDQVCLPSVTNPRQLAYIT